MLEPGTRIDDRYRVLGPLGAGGMGVVYRARDERLGRQVALKTLPKERIGDAKARARLSREARSAAALEHPGIAQVYDVGETEDGGAYLVMELVRGQTLRALMKAGALDRGQMLEILAQVATALDHAHRAGVIHRDIKPDNVMVRDDGRAVLLDFGLAKDLGLGVAETVDPSTPTEDAEHLTKEGTLLGTLSYLAPEQARGRDVGPRSDQFALATTAYEALAGRLPFRGDNAAAVLAQILVDDAPPPSSFESSLPPTVDAVFRRALAKDASERFEDASAFAAALRGAFRGDAALPIDAEPRSPGPPSPEPPSRPAGRSGAGGTVSPRWLGWAAAGGVVLAVGLASSLLWPRDGEPTDPSRAAALADDAVIGCPVLEASGVPEPDGWLGAMGADLACRRLTTRLGGERDRTRIPAELAGLPEVAGDDFPADPWGAEDAREQTMTAARALDAWIDGEIVRTADDTFEAHLSLRREDEVLAQGDGEGAALYVAVGEAVDRLLEEGPLEASERLHPEVARWLGTDSVEAAVRFEELGDASLTGVGVAERCEALMAFGEALGSLRGETRRLCERWGVEGAETIAEPALDRSSPSRLALTAPEHVEELPEDELLAIAAELAAARRDTDDPRGRATLARAEIVIWEHLDEMERARDLLLTAVEDDPRDWFLRVHLVRAMLRTPGAFAATRALAAWYPGSPEAWRTLALPVLRDPDRALPMLRRAYASGWTLPLHGIYLTHALLRAGRREEARAIAARYATAGPDTRLAGELVRARVEISEARFGHAHERLLAAVMELPRLGRLVDGDTDALQALMSLARVLGRERQTADPLVQRFVLADPPRLVVSQPHYEVPSISLCMMASPELASPCLARLRSLRSGRQARSGRVDGAAALLDGAERYEAGDVEGAVAAWRPVAERLAPFLPLDAFDAVRDPALRRRVARIQLRNETMGGAHPAHVIEARRAAREGDTERARELAERVVRAWGSADVEVPAVDEMRALLANSG